MYASVKCVIGHVTSFEGCLVGAMAGFNECRLYVDRFFSLLYLRTESGLFQAFLCDEGMMSNKVSIPVVSANVTQERRLNSRTPAKVRRCCTVAQLGCFGRSMNEPLALFAQPINHSRNLVTFDIRRFSGVTFLPLLAPDWPCTRNTRETCFVGFRVCSLAKQNSHASLHITSLHIAVTLGPCSLGAALFIAI
jgi:hypothetical protein